MNIYYSPEKYGLTQLLCIDHSDDCYCFDYRVVWKHEETNELYTARSAGCSCPSPFEEFSSIEELERVTPELIRSLEYEMSSSESHASYEERSSFIDKLKFYFKTRNITDNEFNGNCF